jgi:hypothetical protein
MREKTRWRWRMSSGKTDRLSVATLRRGAAIELVDDALERVLENIHDPNTDPEAMRQINLTLKLKPDRKREMLSIDVSVASKLAQPTSFSGTAFLINTRDGLRAVENDPRQPGLFEESETVSDDGKVVEAAEDFGGG